MFKYFEQATNAFPEHDPQIPPANLWGFCRHYTKGFEKPLIAMATLSAFIAIIEVALFGFMGKLVDWLTQYTPQTLWQTESTTLIGVSLLLLIGMPLLIGLHSLIIHQSLLGNYPMAIRWQAHRYLLKQSVSFYHNDFAGRIATKVLQTSLAVRETVMKLLDVLIYISVYFFSMLILIAQADFRLMLPMLAWLIAYIGIQYYYVPRLKHIARQQADARSEMTGRMVDTYTNISTVKLFAYTARETEHTHKSMKGFLNTVYRQMRFVTGFNISVEFINYALVFVIGGMAIWLWSLSLIDLGIIAVSISLALRINGMSKWIMWEIGGLFENMGTVVDGMNTLSKPIEIQDHRHALPLVVDKGKIEFNNVGFHYDINQPPVIHHFNLTLFAGEKIGLIGRSGAGKSTLANLLIRFHQITEGTICIDEQNIAHVTQDSLRQQIGMVTQDTALLHRSLRDNLLYGKPNATEAQLRKALMQAQAHHFIPDLIDNEGRQGLDAHVGERGVKLSGGQRQRIAIARVLLKDAPILILDEATSALDSEVESAIQENLTQLMMGKTVIAIAHRLSTIAAMDRLIVIDEGKILEMGTHQELLAIKGIYAKLWAHQTGKFLGNEM